MKILDPDKHTPRAIDTGGTRRFEAFLDRNYPNWRAEEEFRERNQGTIEREWAVGIDDIERHALYRGEYVEIYDVYFETLPDRDIAIHYPKHLICAIDGDLTPIAVWVKRQAK